MPLSADLGMTRRPDKEGIETVCSALLAISALMTRRPDKEGIETLHAIRVLPGSTNDSETR